MDIKRAYRFRFYPTPEQEAILARTFGCARFAYNHMLRLRTDAWYQRQERVGYHETSAALTALKKTPEHAWLNEVSSVPVQQALRHLQTAFANFFAKRAKYPNFRRKDGAQSAEYTTSAFKWDGASLKLAKMDAPLAIRWSRTIPKGAKVTTVTVSKDASGRYHVSMLCDDAVSAKPEVAGKVGIDLGLTHFAILSTGEKIAAPKTFRKNEAKLAKLQRRLAKKQKGSANRMKAKLKVARMHARTADSRRDFLHKLSSRLINENQVIAIESLAVSNMQKNRCLAKSISDASWSEFTWQLEYKAQWYGRALVGIDKWYPSSKRCSDCGHTVVKMPLNIRAWTCPECGSIHDRDINAARNVLAAGLAASAHGESVSPMSL
ncbi:IS200/IS605 family transposase ISPa18 [Paraburkholderia aspalathi]|uniref:IS200/IS605 family transposase ISPa18 n=1 Tax=Paraburkholderia aspalathi TaxID=1324617 RepID=A0ABN7MV25_9BURK|nr:RNA-guided endonuclease TnpB family protein [Paraburkholderia aspalathi]MBK3822021.1 IS200/IS605 family element transposase accessory protein TnpB [Paraburkholderia aspalathi]MBK3833855.1 IS200/IS605 family element transposase accessory protein TnpB [Paraburkholderia aspalathi]MBK3863578.1 IS200/IS605 family element transposase accessory protein TnpB [Paraburkholderia aspalathi]CAE6817727.1 IS200/IS605 family transposase ISPa18 [Paraburkholderia aspalathi]